MYYICQIEDKSFGKFVRDFNCYLWDLSELRVDYQHSSTTDIDKLTTTTLKPPFNFLPLTKNICFKINIPTIVQGHPKSAYFSTRIFYITTAVKVIMI